MANNLHINLSGRGITVFNHEEASSNIGTIAHNHAYIISTRTDWVAPNGFRNVIFRNAANNTLRRGLVSTAGIFGTGTPDTRIPITSRPMTTTMINGRQYFVFRVRRDSDLHNRAGGWVGTVRSGMFIATTNDIMGHNFPHLKNAHYAMRSSDHTWQLIDNQDGGFVDTGLWQGECDATIGMFGLWGSNTAVPLPRPSRTVNEMCINTCSSALSVFNVTNRNSSIGTIRVGHLYAMAEEFLDGSNEARVHFNDGSGSGNLRQGIIRGYSAQQASPVFNHNFRTETINGRSYRVFQMRRNSRVFDAFGNNWGSVGTRMLVACSDNRTGVSRPYLKSINYVQSMATREWVPVQTASSSFGFVDTGLARTSDPNEIFFHGTWSPLRDILDEPLPYTVDHIPTTFQNRRPRTAMEPSTITIHSTGNITSTAWQERNWLTSPYNNSSVSWHIAVDQWEAVEAIPLNEMAHHSGSPYCTQGNQTSIGIEIAEFTGSLAASAGITPQQRGEARSRTLRNAAQVVARLLQERGWGTNRLRTHQGWDNRQSCPRILLTQDPGVWIEPYHTWEWFVNEVRAAMGPNRLEYIWPVADGQPNIVSGRHFQTGHFGIDIRNNYVPGFLRWYRIGGLAGAGARVVAARAGVISHRIEGNDNAGNVFYVAHGDGYFTRYLHLHELDFQNLPFDTPVEQGALLGLTGTTGITDGIGHVHFEIIFVAGRSGRSAEDDAINFRGRWFGRTLDLNGTERGADGIDYTYHRRDPMAGYLPSL